MNLSEADQRTLLYGEWDVFEGQYFTEFDRNIHVVEPFEIPKHWKRYIAIDYGLDMLAVLWFARDTEGNTYVYKELHESNLIVSEAVERIRTINNNEEYECIYAPRDLWNRRQETGKSVADIFAINNMPLVQTSVDRVGGWMATKEWLKVYTSRDIETGEEKRTSALKIFPNCRNLIKNLPQLLIDEKNPNDVATEPHELTHVCVSGDSLIRTLDGNKKIKDIEIGEKVYCYDIENKQIKVSTVECAGMTNPNAEVIEIEFENGATIKVTPNHKILTANGWKMAKELTEQDDVLSFS